MDLFSGCSIPNGIHSSTIIRLLPDCYCGVVHFQDAHMMKLYGHIHCGGSHDNVVQKACKKLVISGSTSHLLQMYVCTVQRVLVPRLSQFTQTLVVLIWIFAFCEQHLGQDLPSTCVKGITQVHL